MICVRHTSLALNDFVGTEHIVSGIGEILALDAGLGRPRVQHKVGCCLISYVGNLNMHKVFGYLYGNGGPTLNRKKQKWAESLAILDRQKKAFLSSLAPEVPPEEAALCYQTMSTPQIAAKYRTNIDKVRKALRLAGVKLRSREEGIQMHYGL